MRTFKTQDELKKFLSPVLSLRVKSLKKEGIELDDATLFKIIKEKKWKHDSNLHLHEMVDDILHFNIEKDKVI